MADGSVPVKKSDLGTRTLSALAMLVVAGAALVMGGPVWAVFVAAVALGVLYEWFRLAQRLTPSTAGRLAWLVAGVVYIGVAAATLFLLRKLVPLVGSTPLVLILGGVIATDIGAYFAGRAIGGPKIAPAISPSKTWAGLGGAIVATTALVFAAFYTTEGLTAGVGEKLAIGVGLPIVAQAGDFFESGMKRRAAVKDSGNLIPGHGGLFDRVDGLLAVSFVLGLLTAVATGFSLSLR